MDLVVKARSLMKEMTEINDAPAWGLTEIAVQKGAEMAEEYELDKDMVMTALYLAHIIFNQEIGGEVQKNHPKLSAHKAEEYLEQWDCPSQKRELITKAIAEHHNPEEKEKFCEVVRNAECYKFVTLKGSLVWLHEAGRRGYSYEKSKELVKMKMEQKLALLTLPRCIEDAKNNVKEIEKVILN